MGRKRKKHADRFGEWFKELDEPLPAMELGLFSEEHNKREFEKRLTLELRKLGMLGIAYGLPPGDFRGLALALARDYLPGEGAGTERPPIKCPLRAGPSLTPPGQSLPDHRRSPEAAIAHQAGFFQLCQCPREAVLAPVQVVAGIARRKTEGSCAVLVFAGQKVEVEMPRVIGCKCSEPLRPPDPRTDFGKLTHGTAALL
jgi:hypothetical protein